MADSTLSDIERALQARHNPTNPKQFASTTIEPEGSAYVKELSLPDTSRGRMPMTQEKFVVHENPARVEWERQLRKFIKRLNTRDTGHRITAPMVFEWTTGLSISEIAKAEGVAGNDPRGGGANGSANMHLRHLNALLKDYFGTPYKTKIAGRQVGKAYKVPQHFKIDTTKPKCLTLWPEWYNGTLQP
ncbi:hypothetical protein SEA_FEDE_1 [Microbacterium phage Fede]|nr:hypothetical protein SEA_FEDE_1 [Microbacterium phage Fede]